MTDATIVLETCRTCGVSVRVDGADLVASPREALTPDLLAELRSAKAELLRVLAVHCAWDVTIPDREPFVCFSPAGCTQLEAEQDARAKWPGATVTPHRCDA